MVYADTISHNGKDGWILRTSGSPQDGWVEIPDSEMEGLEAGNPENEPKVPRWGGSSVTVDKTGTTVESEPNEAKQRLLTKAETPESEGGWGWSRSQIRTLRQDYALMFDFIEAKNYPEAKNEADYAESEGDITTSQRDWIHDLLEGKT